MIATASHNVTVGNVTEGHRTAAGELTITHLGDVTVTLQGMSRAEITEWEWATDALNIGVDEEIHRMAMNGWKVLHPEAGVIGLLFQGAGTRVHAEWYDPTTEDFQSAGWSAKLRHGAAQIVYARQAAGHGVPVDVTPEPYRAPEPARPAWYAAHTEVLYHGSLHELRGGVFRLEECECFDCDGYQLYACDEWNVAAQHVRHTSVTAVQEVTDALVMAA
ncbi:hypothetical protein [Streptomyces scabiei]|uniref:hypothetical protein n=1 Tax=Streptomyces scabiei TaxID=1930 RepID=UPI001B32D4FF|nr:hypothetical protein [Streptomyces sp. LBUM 1479]